MASQLTIDTLGAAVTDALGPRLVALMLYGSAARGTHVPKRSDVNTLLICDAVDAAVAAQHFTNSTDLQTPLWFTGRQ